MDRNRQGGGRARPPAELTARGGFSLAELLVAMAAALLLVASLLAVAGSGQVAMRAQEATIDLDQRLRAVSEAVSADLASAGSGPMTGVCGRALGVVAPAILPFCLGPRGDPPGTARADAVTIVTALPHAAAVGLAASFVPSVGLAQVAMSPGCPVADASCGVRLGDVVMLLDGGGQADLFDVALVTGADIQLTPRGATSGRTFGPGAWLVPVSVASYYYAAETTIDDAQLIAGNGGTSELPFVDHVTGVEVRLFGDPRPPALGSPGVPPGRATYGPTPPPPGVDDPRDAWPAGENCAFLVQDGVQRSRLATLGGGAGLVALSPELLTDGPWCPDADAPNRVDADLFRVREVRVTVRIEAASPAVRGTDSRLFSHPGVARNPLAWVPDRQVTVDVVPRALQVGR